MAQNLNIYIFGREHIANGERQMSVKSLCDHEAVKVI